MYSASGSREARAMTRVDRAAAAAGRGITLVPHARLDEDKLFSRYLHLMEPVETEKGEAGVIYLLLAPEQAIAGYLPAPSKPLPEHHCQQCGAQFWPDEHPARSKAESPLTRCMDCMRIAPEVIELPAPTPESIEDEIVRVIAEKQQWRSSDQVWLNGGKDLYLKERNGEIVLSRVGKHRANATVGFLSFKAGKWTVVNNLAKEIRRVGIHPSPKPIIATKPLPPKHEGTVRVKRPSMPGGVKPSDSPMVQMGLRS